MSCENAYTLGDCSCDDDSGIILPPGWTQPPPGAGPPWGVPDPTPGPIAGRFSNWEVIWTWPPPHPGPPSIIPDTPDTYMPLPSLVGAAELRFGTVHPGVVGVGEILNNGVGAPAGGVIYAGPNAKTLVLEVKCSEERSGIGMSILSGTPGAGGLYGANKVIKIPLTELGGLGSYLGTSQPIVGHASNDGLPADYQVTFGARAYFE